MEFEIYLRQVYEICFSPNDKYVAVCYENNISIYEKEKMQRISKEFRKIQTNERVDKMEFSGDSNLIGYMIKSKNQIYVKSVYESEYGMMMEDGILKIIDFKWNPNSKNIIIESDFNMKLSVIELQNKEKNIKIIKNPK